MQSLSATHIAVRNPCLEIDTWWCQNNKFAICTNTENTIMPIRPCSARAASRWVRLDVKMCLIITFCMVPPVVFHPRTVGKRSMLPNHECALSDVRASEVVPLRHHFTASHSGCLLTRLSRCVTLSHECSGSAAGSCFLDWALETRFTECYEFKRSAAFLSCPNFPPISPAMHCPA